MDPRTTVVMMTRDRRAQLLTSLAHLSALPERPPIILVDNGSTDGTAAAVRAAHPEVSLVEPGRNLGAGARNLGVQLASTPCVAFSDDDSWWAPGALGRAAEHFDACPRLAVLAARTLVGPQERLDPVSVAMAASPLPVAADLPGPSVLGFVACAAVVRRRAFLQAGGFSPVIFFLGEEAVLAQDLAAAGWGLSYADDVVAHHHPQPGADRRGRRQLQARNDVLSAWLRRPLPVALRHTAAALRDGDARPSVPELARRLPAALRTRRRLPAEVEAQVRLLETSGG
ncbi:glycosyltransferase [Rhodococcus sp. X156]|uniref:glycosyltransferase family 2 protein n=1 Tax=Rhodococcus sp. X156 TaxID=2499145 RepID=UPI000FD71276|nr:glycosyltransferase [Rhodococcus sp. X156]